MARTPKQKRIKDADGCEHLYTFYPLAASRGVRILRKVVAHLPAAASQALGSLGKDDSAQIDFSALGGALKHVADLIGDNGDAEFFKDLLTDTTRVNATTGKGCDVTVGFDDIYQCNYGELMEAVYFALDFNFRPAIESLVGNVKRGLASFTKPPTENLTQS